MGLQAESWLHEVGRICTQMDIILDEISPEQAAADCARAQVNANCVYGLFASPCGRLGVVPSADAAEGRDVGRGNNCAHHSCPEFSQG